MSRVSLSERMILYYVGVSLVAIALVGGVIYYISKNGLTERTYNQLTSVRTVKTRQLEQFFTDRLRDARLASGSADVASILEILAHENDSSKVREKVYQSVNTSHILLYLLSGNHYNSLTISLPTGKTIELGNHRNGRDIDIVRIRQHTDNQNPGTKRSLILDFGQGTEATGMLLYACSPVTNSDSTIIGCVSFGIPVSAIDTIMLERDPSKGLGNTGESYLVGTDRLLRSSSRFSSHAILKTWVNSEGVNKAIQGDEGTGIYKDYRGISVLGSYGKVNIPGLNWVILAEIDLPEAMEAVKSLRNNILILMLIIAIAVFGITFIIARRITRPLIQLRKAAIDIGKGNYYKVDLPDSKDEILELTEAFNHMTEELETKRNELAAERSRRFSSVIDGQEQERQRLSMELHDGLGQSLIAMKLRLDTIEAQDGSREAKTLKEVINSVDNTIEEIRRMSNNLMPAILREFGLENAVRYLCEETSRNSRIDVRFHSHCIPGHTEQKVQTYLYRVAQEAMHNMIKHSGADKATVTLSCRKKTLFMDIEDNGQRLNMDNLANSKGNGLYNIRERVYLLNGNLTFTKGKMNGMMIHIEIPLD